MPRWLTGSGTHLEELTEARTRPWASAGMDALAADVLAAGRNSSAEDLAGSVAGGEVGDFRAMGLDLAAGAADGDSGLAGGSGGILIGRCIRILIGVVWAGAIRMGITDRGMFIRTLTS
jgi:hypothetical protein